MARAQDLITANGEGKVDIRHLVEQEIDPYHSARETGPFHIAGPQVLIAAPKATAFAMALHELATNAAKYGALLVASGRVMNWPPFRPDTQA